MVLDEVADRADTVVKAAPTFNADRFAHRDLHAAHIVAVPNRFQQGVGETEDQQVFHTFFAEIVIDAEDLFLGEDAVQRGVQFYRRCEIASKRLLDNDSAALMQPDGCQRFGDSGKHCRRNRHIKHGLLGMVLLEDLGQRFPCFWVAIVALNQVHAFGKRLDRGRCGVWDRRNDRIVGVLAKRLVGPVAAGDADHRHRQPTAVFQLV